MEENCMTIETATKYYVAHKPVRHKTLGLLLIVDLYPSKVDSVRVKFPNGTEIDCQLQFLEAV